MLWGEGTNIQYIYFYSFNIEPFHSVMICSAYHSAPSIPCVKAAIGFQYLNDVILVIVVSYVCLIQHTVIIFMHLQIKISFIQSKYWSITLYVLRTARPLSNSIRLLFCCICFCWSQPHLNMLLIDDSFSIEAYTNIISWHYSIDSTKRNSYITEHYQ